VYEKLSELLPEGMSLETAAEFFKPSLEGEPPDLFGVKWRGSTADPYSIRIRIESVGLVREHLKAHSNILWL